MKAAVLQICGVCALVVAAGFVSVALAVLVGGLALLTFGIVEEIG